MLGKISGAAGLWALMSAKQAQGKADEVEAAVPESVRRSREALATLKRANANRGQDRKAAAKAKVDRLKKELQTLRLMSGGDPKAVARRAAQIARELASAAKEYATSGGSAGLGLPAAAGDASTAEAAPAQGPSEAVAEPQGEAVATAEAPAENSVADTFRQSAAQAGQQGAERKADADFAEEVRRAHAQAKALLREQARRAAERDRDDPEMDGLSRQVDQAGADIQAVFSGGAMIAVPLVLQA